MRFAFATAALALATSVIAGPLNTRDWAPWGNGNCLTQAQANDIVGKYSSILQHIGDANATAQALLADNYQEISDSILSLEGLPLGEVTFSGKQEYIGSTLGAPALTGVNNLAIYVAGCTHIVWYWVFTGIGSKQYEIKGFNLFTIAPNLQIEQVNLEFNSIAWGLDTGYQIIFPPAQ